MPSGMGPPAPVPVEGGWWGGKSDLAGRKRHAFGIALCRVATPAARLAEKRDASVAIDELVAMGYPREKK